MVGERCAISVLQAGKDQAAAPVVLYSALFSFAADYERINVSFNGSLGTAVRVVFKGENSSGECEQLNTRWTAVTANVVHAVPEAVDSRAEQRDSMAPQIDAPAVQKSGSASEQPVSGTQPPNPVSPGASVSSSCCGA